jgi:hypothetical protein
MSMYSYRKNLIYAFPFNGNIILKITSFMDPPS